MKRATYNLNFMNRMYLCNMNFRKKRKHVTGKSKNKEIVASTINEYNMMDVILFTQPFVF